MGTSTAPSTCRRTSRRSRDARASSESAAEPAEAAEAAGPAEAAHAPADANTTCDPAASSGGASACGTCSCCSRLVAVSSMAMDAQRSGARALQPRAVLNPCATARHPNQRRGVRLMGKKCAPSTHLKQMFLLEAPRNSLKGNSGKVK